MVISKKDKSFANTLSRDNLDREVIVKYINNSKKVVKLNSKLGTYYGILKELGITPGIEDDEFIGDWIRERNLETENRDKDKKTFEFTEKDYLNFTRDALYTMVRGIDERERMARILIYLVGVSGRRPIEIIKHEFTFEEKANSVKVFLRPAKKRVHDEKVEVLLNVIDAITFRDRLGEFRELYRKSDYREDSLIKRSSRMMLTEFPSTASGGNVNFQKLRGLYSSYYIHKHNVPPERQTIMTRKLLGHTGSDTFNSAERYNFCSLKEEEPVIEKGKVKCDVCNTILLKRGLKRHNKTKAHTNKVMKSQIFCGTN